MAKEANRHIADMEGQLAIPRKNGEPVFEAPWEARAFGMAVVLNEKQVQPELSNGNCPGRTAWHRLELLRAVVRGARKTRHRCRSGDAGRNRYAHSRIRLWCT